MLPAVPTGDCNGDGVFDIADFGAVADRNGNGLADPEDLILDPALQRRRRRRPQRLRRRHLRLGLPLRRQRPARHRRLRARHRRGRRTPPRPRTAPATSAAARSCRFMPVRVGDSFIADGGRFAAGVLFALDSGRRRDPGGARRDQQPAPGAAGHRRRLPAGRGRGRVDGRRGVEAPRTCRLARAHDGGQLGDREADRPARRPAGRRLPRPQRLHELRRPHVRVGAVGLVLVGGHRAVGGHGRPARELRPPVGRGADPGATAGRPAPTCSSANEAMQIVRADRRRHRLLHAERGRPGQQLRHARTAARCSTPSATRPARAGTPSTATAASTPTSCSRRCATAASRPRR